MSEGEASSIRAESIIMSEDARKSVRAEAFDTESSRELTDVEAPETEKDCELVAAEAPSPTLCS